MRNFTYKILVAIVVFMAGIAGLNAQTNTPPFRINAHRYAIVGKNVQLEITSEDIALQILNVKWYINDTEREDIGTEATATFIPTETDDYAISARVTYQGADGEEYTYGDGEELSAEITVYAEPQASLTPASPYAIIGGKEIGVELSIEDDPSSGGKIAREINWGDCIDDRYNGETSAMFNPAEKVAEDYTITSEVTWTYTKEGETAPIVLYTKNLDKTENGATSITVYAKPTYNLQESQKYYSFVNVGIPTDCFVVSSDEIKNNSYITSNIYLTVDNAICDDPYKPETIDNKQISLNVQYKHGETILYDKQTDYTINIIEKPNWRANFKEIFGTNANGEADNYLYTTSELLSKCSKVIEVQQSNNSNAAIGWSAKYSINDDSPIDFTDNNNSSPQSVALSGLLSSLNVGEENTIEFSFSYEVQNLLGKFLLCFFV